MPLAQEFRARARRRMEENVFSHTWLMLLVVMVIYTAIVTVLSYLIGVSFLLLGPLSVGVYAVVLHLVRSESATVSIEEMFLGFRGDKFLKTFVLGLLENLYLLLWAMLFVVPAIVKSYSYSMAYYIHLDHPEMESNDCITESRRLMDGHKWRLFCLDLSFIGWHILGVLTCGIITLWVIPYQQLAHAYFYDDLVARRRAEEMIIE